MAGLTGQTRAARCGKQVSAGVREWALPWLSEQSALHHTAGKHPESEEDDDHHQHVWFIFHQ